MRIKERCQDLAREVYWSQPRLQRTYARLTAHRAARQEARGESNHALTSYCDAARRLEVSDVNWELRREGLLRLAAFLRRSNGGEWPASPADNPLVAAYLASHERAFARGRVQSWPRADRCSLRENLIILKAPRAGGERGVLMVKFTGMFEHLLVAFQLQPLFARYTVVLEPSWTLVPETFWALFANSNCPPLLLSITEAAAQAMEVSGMPLVPVRLGPHDWVDGQTFRPLGLPKEFDVVMVANFHKIKRHDLLFATLRKLRPRRLKVALVGFTWQRTQAQLEAEMDHYGVREDCTLFRGLTPPEVNSVLNRSRCAVLLSRREGGNKSQMEALAAGVPLVLYRHIIGPTGHMNEMTGCFADDTELGQVLCDVVDHPHHFNPRAWWEQNTGADRSSAILNGVLRSEAEKRGHPWTADIVSKCNRPTLAYCDPAQRESLDDAWRDLTSLLL